MHPVNLDATAVVIRFPPVLPEKIQARARQEFRRSEHFGISVWAGVKLPHETDQEVIQRLYAASQLQMTSTQRKILVCREAGRISAAGFRFLKDGYEGEPAEHYCVDLINDPDLDEVARFQALFPEEVKPR